PVLRGGRYGDVCFLTQQSQARFCRRDGGGHSTIDSLTVSGDLTADYPSATGGQADGPTARREDY
ncbi:hypothetical protein, partial [Microcoleus sp. herbarium12]|uniref:hypothetical protein n=1 Tax=Microcoleus sp. herbarium12 TaxID=3055437 RepID=UPI002FD1CA26